MKLKLTLGISILLIVLVSVLSLFSYCRGRRIGAAIEKHADITKELDNLDKEKHEIRANVHALDTDALRTRILELSSRVHEESASTHSK